MWGTVDVHEDPCMGRRSTPSVGRLTVLHVVGDVGLLRRHRKSGLKLSMHIIIISSMIL